MLCEWSETLNLFVLCTLVSCNSKVMLVTFTVAWQENLKMTHFKVFLTKNKNIFKLSCGRKDQLFGERISKFLSRGQKKNQFLHMVWRTSFIKNWNFVILFWTVSSLSLHLCYKLTYEETKMQVFSFLIENSYIYILHYNPFCGVLCLHTREGIR